MIDAASIRQAEVLVEKARRLDGRDRASQPQ
jgi:hypothetical protein